MYIVITGTSRGIGLELTKIGLSKGHQVCAVARHPEESKELQQLKSQYASLMTVALDILDKDADKKLFQAVEHWPKVDVIINNAGIYEKDHSSENFEKTFLTNSIRPYFLTRALFPRLRNSDRPVALEITSKMGSLTDNTSGGSYSYRASKAALNMIFKCLSIDEKWLISLLVHPGWVQTNMGGESAPVSPFDSASGIWKLLEEAAPSQSGSFRTYLGETIPW